MRSKFFAVFSLSLVLLSLMAAAKLSKDQRLILLRLIAADYSNAVIFDRLGKITDFPALSGSAIDYYRAKYSDDLLLLRKERSDKAIASGLALKAERIARLCEHADVLELRKWEVSLNGRCWNEKAWRETLDDIAREMGERRPLNDDGGMDEIVKVYIGVDYDKV